MASGRSRHKVVLLGEGRVGKTSLLSRYVNDTFAQEQVPTVQASCVNKLMRVDGQQVELSVWDTAGQERFHALGPIYYRDADAALLVFDITDVETFDRVKKWVKELRQMVGSDLVVCIAANKQDLRRNQVVSEAESKEYALSIGASHFGTSAMTGEGIKEAFEDIAARVGRKKAAAAEVAPAGASLTSRRQRPLVVLLDEPKPARNAWACCG